MPKARRETFLRRVAQTRIDDVGAVFQVLSCGHKKRVLSLCQNPAEGPILPRSRYCDECAVAAGRRRKRKAA